MAEAASERKQTAKDLWNLVHGGKRSKRDGKDGNYARAKLEKVEREEGGREKAVILR